MKKIFLYILIIIAIFISCKDNSKENNQPKNTQINNEISSENNLNLTILGEIEKTLQDPPKIQDKNAEKFISEMQGYLSSLLKASQDKDIDKIIEIQEKAIYFDDYILKLKKDLKQTEYEKVQKWYLKIVELSTKL